MLGNCRSCGAPKVHEGDEFCRDCGQPHAAVPPAMPTAMPPVPPPAAPPAMPTAMPPAPMPPAAPPTAPPAPPAQAGWPPAAAPAYPGAPVNAPLPVSPAVYAEPPKSGSTAGKVVAIGGLVIALVAVGFVAWHFFWPRGGAGSPEGAAENMVMSIADQDAVGLIDMISPGEVEGLDDVYDAAFERAEDEELVNGDGITDALDIELSDLEFEVDELGDDLARVTLVGGEYDVSWDPEKLPERLDFLEEESESESESGDLEDLFDGEEPSVMTVKIDGRWYVTLLGTVADYGYQDGAQEAEDSDYDIPDPDWDLAGEDVDPITGDDPEEVIENLVEAINAGDVEDLLANLPEDLVKPLRPYIPVIEDLKEEGGWAEGELGLEVSAEDLDLSTEDLDDGKVKVTIEGGTFSGSASEEGYDTDTGSITVDGECVEVYEDDYLAEDGCISDSGVVEDIGIDEIFFVLREVDGGFQLDPAATWVEYASIAVENLTGDLIDMIVEEIEDEV